MPALATPRSRAGERYLRLTGTCLIVLLLASVAVAWGAPASARDWTPQIKATRAAQVYWESVMRTADRDVRHYKRATRQATRQVRKSVERTERRVDRRASARRALNEASHALREARIALAMTTTAPPPPPDPELAAQALTLALPANEAMAASAGPVSLPVGFGPAAGASTGVPGRVAALEVTVGDVKRMERQVKNQQRALKKATRRAHRAAADARRAKARLASTKAAVRSAIARRESAERSLGAWILAMERYGRTRAQKKSKVRPGVNAAFAWPARGRLTQAYSRSHDGIDIASYRGAPIRAAAYGVISYIGWNPWDKHGRAFMIVVAHASGFETLYGHVLPRRSVRVGQEVGKGEVIGYMGSTGYSTGTHLHFELRRGRTTVNPLGYL